MANALDAPRCCDTGPSTNSASAMPIGQVLTINDIASTSSLPANQSATILVTITL